MDKNIESVEFTRLIKFLKQNTRLSCTFELEGYRYVGYAFLLSNIGDHILGGRVELQEGRVRDDKIFWDFHYYSQQTLY